MNSEVLEQYRISIKNKYLPTTVVNHCSMMNMLFKAVNKPVEQITRQDIDIYLATLKPSTCEIMKCRIRSFFKWYYKTGKKSPDFIADLEANAHALIQTRGDEVVLSPDQIESVLTHANTLQFKAIIETLLTTGMRVGELVDLTVGDIKEEGNTVWITIKRSRKTQKPRRIPVVAYQDNPCARYPKFLLMWIETHSEKNNPSASLFNISIDCVERTIKKIGVLAGIPHPLTPHHLRHTSATYDGSRLVEIDLCVEIWLGDWFTYAQALLSCERETVGAKCEPPRWDYRGNQNPTSVATGTQNRTVDKRIRTVTGNG